MNGARRPAEALHETVKPSSAPESVALLLQGGGALGSYQAGVYQALLERGIEPTWIAGISIGAINSAIIAGNSAGDRLAKLRAFWETVSDAGDNCWSDRWAGHWQSDRARGWINRLASGRVIAGGVRGFFRPRIPPPYLLPASTAGVTSYYDVTGLWSTLERLIDFDRINAKAMRFSGGAVNVRTGNFAYFDNETDTIRPEHIMASCALMLFIMATILMVQLQSFQRLFLVVAVAPLALIGVVAALLSSSAPLGFVAILGVLALIGILIRNSVILIVQIEQLRAEG